MDGLGLGVEMVEFSCSEGVGKEFGDELDEMQAEFLDWLWKRGAPEERYTTRDGKVVFEPVGNGTYVIRLGTEASVPA